VSIDGAIGRIDQILQLQQQVFDPAAASAATSPSATSTSSTDPTTSAGGASSTFAAALAEAEASAATGAESSALTSLAPSATDTGDGTADSMSSDLGSSTSSLLLSALEQAGAGTSSTTGVADTAVTAPAATTVTATSGPDGGTATSIEDPRVQAMVQEANSLVGQPYVWGGGHSGWGQQSGYDCSGFVSAVLHAGGYLSTPQDTVTLPTAAGIESGPGQYVTIYDRNEPGQEGHVIIDIGGQFYESGGEAGSWGGGGGVEKIGTPSAAYLATFNDVLHPAGL